MGFLPWPLLLWLQICKYARVALPNAHHKSNWRLLNRGTRSRATKLEETTSIQVSVWRCLDCNISVDYKLSRCREQGHHLKAFKVPPGLC